MSRLSVWLLAGLVAINFCGMLSAAEGDRKERRKERKAALDNDQDGKIDHGELHKALEAEIGAIDADKDGKIDHGEGREALKKLFDSDKDGKLDHGEIKKALEELKEKHPALYERLMKRLREKRHDKREDRREDKK